MKIIMFIFIFSLTSCSSTKVKEPSRAESYFSQWSEDFQIDSKEYQTSFKSYLLSVEDLFRENALMPKFESYISSMNNFYQLMAHTEFNLPQRYKNLKGHRLKILSRQYEKLKKEREKKLKYDLGDDFFEKLKALHSVTPQPAGASYKFLI